MGGAIRAKDPGPRIPDHGSRTTDRGPRIPAWRQSPSPVRYSPFCYGDWKLVTGNWQLTEQIVVAINRRERMSARWQALGMGPQRKLNDAKEHADVDDEGIS
jgi:hypothetical protein